jgi:hypothetical protein
LLEWIQGNIGEDTLKNMEIMHKLKIPSLVEVHSLKGLEAALPRLFGNVITFTGYQNTIFYTKVASALVWTNGSTGTKEFILSSLAMMINAVQSVPAAWQGASYLGPIGFGVFVFIHNVHGFIYRGKQGVLRPLKLVYPDTMQWSLKSILGYRVWQAGLMEKVESHHLQAIAAMVIYHVLMTIDISGGIPTGGNQPRTWATTVLKNYRCK